MAKKDSTIQEKLKYLFDLQTIDNKLKEIAILRGELPNEVNDLEDEIIGLETRKGKINDQISDLTDTSNKHKGNITTSETLIERYKEQLDNVKNNREFEALSKEIEMQNLEIQLSEKKLRENMVKVEAKTESLDHVEQRIDELNELLAQKKVELEKIIEKTEKDEKSLNRKSKSARKKIDERILKAYDRIRATYKNGYAVVTVERDSCGGCFNRIPPQVQLEIGLRKKIQSCEHCGRILVDNDTAGVLVEA